MSGATQAAATQSTTEGVATLLATPEAVPATQFPGLAMSDAGNFFPPDPWVAVNGTYVVQSVNSAFRVTNRAGAELAIIPVWSLFALPGDQTPTDPRVIWDATHGRWVAIAASYNADDSFDYMNLAVSETADPTAAWQIIAIGYADAFPDYPSVASSNDKIVITDNLFDSSFTYLGAELNTLTWASILAGASVTYHECLGPFIHARAAQVLSPSNDVHLIMAGEFGEQIYFRLSGVGNCDAGDVRDGTDFSGFGTFLDPPDPRQDGDPLSGAIDGRPTDAVWQNGKLWWVSTYPWTYDGGTTFNDAVVIWHATTYPTGQAIQGGADLISAGDGIDDFMGGIGLTRGGTLIAVYSESSPTTLISMRALRIPPGGSIDTSIELDASDAAISSSPMRWGDFAGVAMDPVGSGSAWVTHEVAASDGTWRTTVARLVIDADTPTTPGVVTGSLVTPTTLGSAPAVRLAWGASTDGASGTVHYRVAQSIDGGPFSFVGTVGGTSTIRPLTINHNYAFQISAIDAVGTVGAARLSPTFRNYLYQSNTSATVYTTGWGTSTNSAFSGGSTKYSSTAGKYATFTATNARSIAIVATKAVSRGSFKVYVDGVYKATVSTYSTTTRFRQLVYQVAWAAPGTHKIRVAIVGTSGHPRVDLDAFVVLR